MQNCEASKAQLLKYVAALSKKPRLCANAGSYLRSVKRNVALSSTLALKKKKKTRGVTLQLHSGIAQCNAVNGPCL